MQADVENHLCTQTSWKSKETTFSLFTQIIPEVYTLKHMSSAWSISFRNVPHKLNETDKRHPRVEKDIHFRSNIIQAWLLFEVGETWGNLSNFFLLSSPKTHPPSHSQLQLVTPIMTRRKTRRKKTSPETTYTIAEVIEMDTDDSISAIFLHKTSLAKLRLLFMFFFSFGERL